MKSESERYSLSVRLPSETIKRIETSGERPSDWLRRAVRLRMERERQAGNTLDTARISRRPSRITTFASRWPFRKPPRPWPHAADPSPPRPSPDSSSRTPTDGRSLSRRSSAGWPKSGTGATRFSPATSSTIAASSLPWIANCERKGDSWTKTSFTWIRRPVLLG